MSSSFFWTAPGSMDTDGLIYAHRRKSISTKRYTPEFKDEAVRQVTERGYKIAEVAKRLSVSTGKRLAIIPVTT